MDWTQKVYIVGQILDIIGASVVFYFGNIPGLNKLPGTWIRSGNPTEKEFWRAKWYPKLANWGFLIILLGFALQFAPSAKQIIQTFSK